MGERSRQAERIAAAGRRRAGLGPARSLLGSTLLHGVVLGAGLLLGLARAARIADVPGEPDRVRRLAAVRPAEPPPPDERERELERVPEPDVPPEPEPPPDAPPEPVEWAEAAEPAPLPPPRDPDLRTWASFEPRPAEPEPELPEPEPEPEAPAAEPASPPAPAATGPVPVHRPAVTYPFQAQRLGQEGTVLCRIEVDASGEVVRVVVEESSGHDLLDEAAREQLMRWRFRPATRGGEAVAETYPHRVTFQLKG